jgi:hypothetical protein
MIYAIHGNDVKKIREKTKEIVDSLLHKRPDSNHIRITPDKISEIVFEELIEAQGLFSEKMIIEINSVLSLQENVASLVERMKNSPHVFIVIEENFDESYAVLIEKSAYKIEKFDLKQEREDFTLFPLADALGLKDKKMLWVHYTQAIMRDIAPEEIHGMLFWQIKSMIIASKTVEKDSGLKPFVYKKSKKYSSNFKEKELQTLSSSLISIYHDARRGLIDFNLELERWILKL